ncbi:MAG: hypothetical protein KA069_00015 [Candidatus Saccharimonas sp.]|nr:hypothetical protein [Candidatus Saccharimonas sp.]
MPSSLKREDEIDNAYDFSPAARSLKEKELSDSGLGGAESDSSAIANADNPTDIARAAEQNPSADYLNNVTKPTNPGGGSTKAKVSDFLKKKGPLGVLAGAVGIGGFFSFGPVGLMHAVQIVKDKVDTMSSVQEPRSHGLLLSRIFGGTDTATAGKCSQGIKMFCRYSSLGEDQMKRLKDAGYKVVDGNGEELKLDKNGRYSGGKSIITPELKDGQPIKVDAKQFRTKLASDSTFREIMRGVYPSRAAVWRDKIASTFFKDKRLIRDPKWTTTNEDDDPKTRVKEVSKNLAEAETGGEDLTQGQNGGDFSDAVEEEKQTLKTDLENGHPASTPSDMGEIMNHAPYEKKLGSKVWEGINGALNPAAIVTEMCQGHQYAKIIVDIAKFAGIAVAMRWATQIISSGEMAMAGDAATSDVSIPMEILQKPDANGDNFGDSTAYSWSAYDKPTNTPIQTGITGGAILSALTAYLLFTNKISVTMPGGGAKVGFNEMCNIATTGAFQFMTALLSLIIQVILAITTVGTGNVAVEGAMAAARGSAKVLINKIIEQVVKRITEKLAKDAIKSTLKDAGKQLVKFAASLVGSFLIGYIIERYLVPYIAHLATGTVITGEENGVAAFDTVAMGAGAAAGGIALSRALTPLSRKSYLAFAGYNESYIAQYSADQNAAAGTFDFNNPYSTGSVVASSLSNFFSKFNIIKYPQLIGHLPTSLFSWSGGVQLDTAMADISDREKLMDECDDPDVKEKGLATDPYCNVIYGFNDINMLENTSPESVATFMKDNNYVDNDGNPVAGSAFDAFRKTCIDGANEKAISTVVPDEKRLPAECYDEQKNATTIVKMFRLYLIDQSVADGMETGIKPLVADTAATTTTTTTSVGPGTGSFTDNGQVVGFDNVYYNAMASEQAVGDALEGAGQCARVTSYIWHGTATRYGYPCAIDLWNQNPDKQHADRNPPKGAILLYTKSSCGHVVIYLGNNKVLNDGHVRDASFIENNWGQTYKGWVDPNTLGWTSVKTTNITSLLSDFRRDT